MNIYDYGLWVILFTIKNEYIYCKIDQSPPIQNKNLKALSVIYNNFTLIDVNIDIRSLYLYGGFKLNIDTNYYENYGLFLKPNEDIIKKVLKHFEKQYKNGYSSVRFEKDELYKKLHLAIKGNFCD